MMIELFRPTADLNDQWNKCDELSCRHLIRIGLKNLHRTKIMQRKEKEGERDRIVYVYKKKEEEKVKRKICRDELECKVFRRRANAPDQVFPIRAETGVRRSGWNRQCGIQWCWWHRTLWPYYPNGHPSPSPPQKKNENGKLKLKINSRPSNQIQMMNSTRLSHFLQCMYLFNH